MITRTSGRAPGEMHLVTGGASLALFPFFEETAVRLSVPLVPRCTVVKTRFLVG